MYYEKHKFPSGLGCPPRKGLFCVALYSVDQTWYRAYIEEVQLKKGESRDTAIRRFSSRIQNFVVFPMFENVGQCNDKAYVQYIMVTGLKTKKKKKYCDRGLNPRPLHPNKGRSVKPISLTVAPPIATELNDVIYKPNAPWRSR